MSRLIDLTGQRFGRLSVVQREANDKAGKPRWMCVCDCGNRSVVASADLKKKNRGTKSCGCLARDRASESQRTHGMSKHPVYAVWRSMLARCNNASHFAYHNYGARGISVCPEWHQFEDFWRDMHEAYAPGLTLDRIDNNLGYCRENCRWVGFEAQAQNRRGARLVMYNGRRLNVSVAARETGIKANTILYRIAHGWPEADLFKKPDPRNRVA